MTPGGGNNSDDSELDELRNNLEAELTDAMDPPDLSIIAAILEIAVSRSVFSLDILVAECPEVMEMLTPEGRKTCYTVLDERPTNTCTTLAHSCSVEPFTQYPDCLHDCHHHAAYVTVS